MAIGAYKALYGSSVVFGVRKQLQAEQGMTELEQQIAELEEQKKEKENHVLELRNRVEVIEKAAGERAQSAGGQKAQGRARLPQIPGAAPG